MFIWTEFKLIITKCTLSLKRFYVDWSVSSLEISLQSEIVYQFIKKFYFRKIWQQEDRWCPYWTNGENHREKGSPFSKKRLVQNTVWFCQMLILITGNALERVQRVQKPADVWDITPFAPANFDCSFNYQKINIFTRLAFSKLNCLKLPTAFKSSLS